MDRSQLKEKFRNLPSSGSGSKLKGLLNKHGLHQSALAYLVGFHPSYVSKVVNNKVRPSQLMRHRIAKEFDVSESDIWPE
jgi:transcriptional regulator with XRE-family HTH domain